MNGIDKYRHLFGHINNLADAPGWTEGVSNVVDWLVWSTGGVLGISKTQYWKMIVDWCDDEQLRSLPTIEKKKAIAKRLAQAVKESEAVDRFDPPRSLIASPREALRRARYFSEDYLNKEFDICWSLASNHYLDSLYSQFFGFAQGTTWHSHGNGNLFVASVGIGQMQMDNLSYNPEAQFLVANELKLGGRKNSDQILKYAHLFNELSKRGFIEKDTDFGFLLFGDECETRDWNLAIQEEIDYCAKKGKGDLVTAEIQATAKKMTFGSIRWNDLVSFNDRYTAALPASAEVERTLLAGFSSSLKRRKLVMGEAVEL